MIIAFGTGLILGRKEGEYTYEIQEISGLESPAVRNGNGLYSGEDGGYWVSQYFGHRTVVIKGFSIIDCANDIHKARKNMLDKLPIRYICPVIIEDANGDYWYIEGCITDIKADLKNFNSIEYQITIVCTEPLIYPANSLLDFHPTYIEKEIELNGPTTNLFVNQGAMYAWAYFEIKGVYTTPLSIENVTTGDKVIIDNSTTENSDITIVDLKNRAITLNGSTINDKMSVDSTWFKLVEGNNRIKIMSGDSEDDTATIGVKYSVGYRGI